MATAIPLGGARRSRTLAASAWQEPTVAAVIEETPDAATLRLRLGAATGFLPGQCYVAPRAIWTEKYD